MNTPTDVVLGGSYDSNNVFLAPIERLIMYIQQPNWLFRSNFALM